MTGIALTDARLAGHPRHALFFGIFALFIYAALVFSFSAMLFPSIADAAAGEGENATQLTWIMQVVLQVVILLHLTFWAEHVGAGPFAGPVETNVRWASIGILIAPALYFLATAFGLYVLAGGEADWAYKDGVSLDAVSRAALGPIMVLSVVVLAPVVEEVTYRGVVLGFLLGRGFPPAIAVGVSALGFTALHLQYTPAALFSVFVLGLFLGWLRYASKSIGPPILAHMAVNLYGVMTLWNSAS